MLESHYDAPGWYTQNIPSKRARIRAFMQLGNVIKYDRDLQDWRDDEPIHQVYARILYVYRPTTKAYRLARNADGNAGMILKMDSLER